MPNHTTLATTTEPGPLRSCHRELDTSPEAFGTLRSSADAANDAAVLRERMREDGYLFIPGYLDREEVLEARRSVTARLAAEGLLDPIYPPEEAVAAPGLRLQFKPDLAHENPALHRLLYSGRTIHFFEGLLGGPVRHYDFTWMRAIAPGPGTHPHGDIVFMGRGTHDLYTAWAPLGDVDLVMGGLMVLEGSHRLPAVRDEYARHVDAYCANVPGEREHALESGWRWNGSIDEDQVALRERLGGRWLTSEYRAGDLLAFSVYLIHGSLDNRGRTIRLSSDSRYQLTGDPVDERWVGAAPVGHGAGGKRGMIC